MSALAEIQLSVGPTAQIEFGVGALSRLPAAMSSTGAERAFVVTDAGVRAAGVVDRVVAVLAAAGYETVVHDGIEPNPSTENLDVAGAHVRELRGAAVVAVGGGSVLDAAKGIALLGANAGAAADFDYRNVPALPGLPVVAIPTTSGTGAETNGFGVIEDRVRQCKIYVGHDSVRPVHVVLDPELTLGLPARITAATGMDALVHGIESLASRGSTPLSAAYACEAITLVSTSLRGGVADGSDLELRSRLMLGSHLAGLALSLSGLGLVHGIAHSLTNHVGAVHGVALSAVLDEVMARTLESAPDLVSGAYGSVAAAMGVGRTSEPAIAARAAVSAVRDLAEDVGTRARLQNLGVREDQIATVAVTALADMVSDNHPYSFPATEVEDILRVRW